MAYRMLKPTAGSKRQARAAGMAAAGLMTALSLPTLAQPQNNGTAAPPQNNAPVAQTQSSAPVTPPDKAKPAGPASKPAAPASKSATPASKKAAVKEKLIAFEFHHVSIDDVLRFYANASGLTITKDPALTGPVTIINPRRVTVDEAFKILQSVLYLRGFSAFRKDNVIMVLPFKGGHTDPADAEKPFVVSPKII